MRTTATVAILLAALLLSGFQPVEALDVVFELDGVQVAEMECGTPPFSGRLRLLGKSGADGTDERSGLYDNLHVERLFAEGGSELVRIDDFTNLDESFWSPFHYGWPTSPGPRLLYDFGSPAPCLMTAGTTYDYGGLLSHASFDWTDGFDFAVDVFIENAADYPHVVEFGITNPQPDNIVIGGYWGQNGSSERVLRLWTPFDIVELEQPTPGEWHRVRMVCDPLAPYLDITVPGDGGHYSPCGPPLIEWYSNFAEGEVNAVEVFWRPVGGIWESLGVSDNDGEHPWPDAPCDEGHYEVRLEYIPDPSIDDVAEFQVGGYFVNITSPVDGQTIMPCGPGEIEWSSNVDPAAGDVLEILWRECGGAWESLGLQANTGLYVWESPPCDPGCYEVRIEYALDASVSDAVAYELDQHALFLTSPTGGSTCRPCAPDEITWNSSIDPGAGDVLEIFWRECGGAWASLGLSSNDGAHSWVDPPCDPGCYEVRVEYVLDPTLHDEATFSVAPHFLNITRPIEGRVYRPCAPSRVRWNSSVDPGEGEVILVEWRTSFTDWEALGTSVNDGVLVWPSPPCEEPWYHEVRVEYLNDPTVCDTVSFRVGPYELPDAQYAIFVDFSGDAYSLESVFPRIDPHTNFPFQAYIGVGNLDGSFVDWGLTSVSFAVSVTEGMSAWTSYTNLLPGDLAIGSWESGITLAASECTQPEVGVLYLARINLFYTGTPGDIVIADHPEYPRWVLDCDDPPEQHTYCVYVHGGVGQYGPSGDPGCDPDTPTPVKETTWGAIKAMYR